MTNKGGEEFERILRGLCSDQEWAVFHRRLHPEQYPAPTFWQRLRAIVTFSELPGDPDF